MTMSRVRSNDDEADDTQGGGTLGGWLLALRAPRSVLGSWQGASLGPSSVICASTLMLRAMHERVDVISVEASTKRVRPRSASIAEQSDTIFEMIEWGIATESPFSAAVDGFATKAAMRPQRELIHVSR